MSKEISTYYDPEKMRKPWLRIVVIGIILVLLILFVILILIGTSKKNSSSLYNDLVTKAKEYYINNDSEIPIAIGECSEVQIEKLVDSKELEKKYNNCTEASVKICKITDNEYQYTPLYDCGQDKITFGEWMPGSIDDIIQGNSDVMFKFVPQVLKNGTKKYYPNEIENPSKVSQYYNTYPTKEYKYFEDPSIAYKWYKEENGKDYYNNGEYKAEQPNGYSEKTDEKVIKYGSLVELPEINDRKVSEATIYAIEYVSYPYKFECVDEKLPGAVTSPTMCEKRNSDTFKKTKGMYYTCDGITTVKSETLCKARSDWQVESCYDNKQTRTGTTNDGYDFTRQVSTGKTCISTKGYAISETAWRWYNTGLVKKYYPSETYIENDEMTYYIKNPTPGASKDENTKTYAYKYYKFEENSNSPKTWVTITDITLNEEQIVEKFQDLRYNVNSLADISKTDDIRYQIEIYYRNRK